MRSILAFWLGLLSYSAESDPWVAMSERASGQVVYFNAWGGSPSINAYIRRWSDAAFDQYGINVRHVKVDDISPAITSIHTAKLMGQKTNGPVDLVWINGENFARMKRDGLLGPAFVEFLPNAFGLDLKDISNLLDFSIPTDGLEAPWGRARLVFVHDSLKLSKPPKTLSELVAYARAHPGRVTYPEPPNFHGTTFLKQVLLETTRHPDWLSEPYEPARFEEATMGVWSLLDQLNSVAWRSGREFPDSAEEMMELFADGVLDIAFTFNPNDASARILDGRFLESVRTYVHRGGTIGNTHFLAIPFNAKARDGALIFINLLLSAKAQADKADPNIWGDPTVLDLDRLSLEDRSYFDMVGGPATLTQAELGPGLPEPHASWTEPLEAAWLNRYVGSKR
ncbi:ABC transporter substrate-binding protein [Litorivicinus sp.]|nr:ABC transporter substrate-binding protein [Litorivicinus sp.]